MTNLDFMGDDKDKVTAYSARWDKILQEAVIVDLSVFCWYPHATLTSERMGWLGLKTNDAEAQQAAKRLLHAGKINLVPGEYINAIVRVANSMRENLRSTAHKIMWGYLVPGSAYDAWRTQHDALLVDFWSAVDNLVDNLDELTAQCEVDYRTVFADAYKRLKRASAFDDDPGESAFVDGCIRDLRSKVPTAEKIREQYRVDVDFRYAPLQDEVAEAEKRALDIRAALLNSKGALDEERRRILSRLQRDVEAQVEDRRRKIEEGLAAAERAFYEETKAVIDDLKKGLIDRKGALGGRASTQLQNLLKKVRSLNVFDDDRLTIQMAEIEKLTAAHFNAPRGDRDQTMKELVDGLNTVSQHARAQLAEVGGVRGVRRVAAPKNEAPAEKKTVRRKSAKNISAPVDKPTKSVRRRHAVVIG